MSNGEVAVAEDLMVLAFIASLTVGYAKKSRNTPPTKLKADEIHLAVRIVAIPKLLIRRTRIIQLLNALC